MVFRRVERVPLKAERDKAYQLRWHKENRKRLKEQFPERYQELRKKEKAYVARRIAEEPELRARAVRYAQKYRAANLEKLREYDRSEHRRALAGYGQKNEWYVTTATPPVTLEDGYAIPAI